jgi:hypothetical protein
MLEDKTKKPVNLEQLQNMINEEKGKDQMAEIKKQSDQMPDPAIADPAIIVPQLLAVINHFIPDFGRWREVKTLMKLRLRGASTKEIAFAFNVPESTVIMLEKLGQERIMKGIEREKAFRVLPKGNPKTRVIY